MTDASFYDKVGGAQFFRDLVDDFYAGVVTDPVLMKMVAKADPGNQYGVPWAWGTTPTWASSTAIIPVGVTS